MVFSQLAAILSESVQAGQNVYLRFEPEVLDFTDKEARPELFICGSGGNQASIVITESNFPRLFSILRLSIFSKGMRLICWNLKNFFSFVRAKGVQDFQIEAAIVDLKIIESYVGIKQAAPKTLAESLLRLKYLVNNGLWQEAQDIYRRVHLPLMTDVLPALETVGVLDKNRQSKVHAYYEIDGQENGRLRCWEAYKSGFVPHTLSQDQKAALQPLQFDELFMSFDFRSMEVAMLQWLSKDEKLGAILNVPDIYLELYEQIIGLECDGPEKREIAKKFFLPVIYGQSAFSLADRLNIGLTTAEQIVSRINVSFATAVAYVESHQKQVEETGLAKDVFGKRRKFEGREYRVRNFAVQSPASIFCLEKLIQLHRGLRGLTNVAFHVHDGYVVYATKKNWKEVFQKSHEILSSESEVCPGLRLKVACSAGRHLDSLKPIKKHEGGE